MKKEIHRAKSRGHFNYGWLDTHYSFSFAEYYNPSQMGFGALRVLNDDTILGGGGFPFHSHADMEIVTILLSGELEHKDSTGGGGIIKAGDVQAMSAGTGITHSEFNHAKKEPVSLLQVWVLPERKNITPRYEQKTFSKEARRNKFQIIISPKKSSESLLINERAFFSLADLEKGKGLEYSMFEEKHGVYIFVIEGGVSLFGEKLEKRDAIAVSEANLIAFKAESNSSILTIEVPYI